MKLGAGVCSKETEYECINCSFSTHLRDEFQEHIKFLPYGGGCRHKKNKESDVKK